GEDLDSLFITGGLAAAETKTDHQPDPTALKRYLDAEIVSPTYAIGMFR
ncbi:MAG: TIGR01459 family HAD-type hydrolase, partial [Planktomarina sp.]